MKLDIDCVFLPPAIKKTRRRNETRIKELERKFQQIQQSISEPRSAPLVSLSGPNGETDAQFSAPSDGRSPATTPSTLDSLLLTPSPDDATADPVSRGLLNHNQAEGLYWAFCHNFEPLYPLVHVPESLTCEETRITRPALFRAIITAASSSTDPNLSRALFHDTGKFLAEKVVVSGERSLDLVQALLIMSTWQQPPEKFQRLKFSQSSQLAATMVMDLQSSNDENYKIPDPKNAFVPSDHLIETCRSFLACYFLCSSIALSFRRPNGLRYGAWVERSTKVLEMAPFLHPNDRRLLAWARLQRLAEESLTMVGFDEGMAVDFSDTRTRFILRNCAQAVTKWRESIPEDIMCGPLEIHYQMILVSLDEPALYGGHEIADFRPPYVIRALPLAKKPQSADRVNVIGAITKCAVSAQQLITAFINLPVEVLRSAPVITYTRMSYAVIVLIKVYVSTQRNGDTENSLLDKEWTPKHFLVRILEKLELAAGQQRLDISVTFSCVLANLARWCASNLDQNGLSGQFIEPMIHLPGKTTNSDTSSVNSDPNHLMVPGSLYATPSEPATQETTFQSWSNMEDFSLLGDLYLGTLGSSPGSGMVNSLPEFDFDRWDIGSSSS